ncbi:HAMP domain-containing protein, partial [Enterococcus casseliflavus]|uniref:HAMP domain-containing protein n=1 Tax=Enterococcus casseliflavus TaxID=37734 RepID=UPI003D0D30FF
GVAALAALGVAHLLAGPITRLTGVAAQVAAGNLNAQAPVESGDEIGTLAAIFNTMTWQLREFIDSLESRVSARTQQLETVV